VLTIIIDLLDTANVTMIMVALRTRTLGPDKIIDSRVLRSSDEKKKKPTSPRAAG
jgi:hypothetical protein